MIYQPVISIFENFDKKEKKLCKAFLGQTSAFGKVRRAQFVAIFEKLEEGIRDDEALFQSTQNEEIPYDSVEFSYIKSDLLAAIEDFFCQKEIDKNQQFLYLLKVYRKKSLDRNFLSTYKKWDEWQRKQTQKDSAFFMQKSAILEIFAGYQAEKRQESNALEEAEIAFNFATAIRKMRIIAADKVNYNRINDHNVDFVTDLSKKINDDDLPLALKMYYYCFMLFEEQNTIQTTEILAFLKKNLLFAFGIEEQVDVFNILIKYATKKANIREENAAEQLFEWHEFGIKYQLHFVGKYITEARFLNIVRVGIRFNEVKWVAAFIENFRVHLEQEQGEELIAYTKMLLYFKEKKYNDLEQLAQSFDSKDMNRKLEIKRMMVKYYFDAKEEEVLKHYLEAFKQFLYQHREINKTIKDSNRNFIKYAKKLLNKKTKNIKESIEKENLLAEKEWFLAFLSNHKIS